MEFTGLFRVVLFSLALVRAAEVLGSVEIPSTYDGFVFPKTPSNGATPVLLEAFIDPLCGNCKDAWPTIKSVQDHYGPAVMLIIHTFPTPYHHNAYFAARALHISYKLNATLTIPLLELIFRDQSSLSNDATADDSPNSIIQRFISLGVEAGYAPHLFWAGFMDSSTDQTCRTSFKYGSARSVTWTPSFLVNGFSSPADENWSFEDWQVVLDPMVEANAQAAQANQIGSLEEVAFK